MATDTTRVSTWDGYIGQEALKARLRIHIDAAVEQCRTLEHVLLAARPGFGKTSLAGIIAGEMNARFEAKTMPITEKAIADLVMECDSYGEYCVLFLDEIHAASKKEQEFLLPLLEFGHIQTRKGHVYEAMNLTIIGATTEADKLIRPLRDRFPLQPDFDDYTVEDMQRMILGMAKMAGVEMDEETAYVLAPASGGVPRRARTFVLAARDLAVKHMRPANSEEILDLCRVDEQGLSADHYKYLRTLHLMGGTSGLANLKSVLCLPEVALRDLEMLLLRHDFIELTSGGRSLLPMGARKIHLKRKQESVT